MRLQSAIFTLPDALLDGGALRPGADKVLSILKMESVWLYAVTALDRAEAQALLRSAGIEGDFCGLLTECEAGCAVCSGTMLEKPRAMPWARGFCPLPFRYAPVTVGSGRVELTCET